MTSTRTGESKLFVRRRVAAAVCLAATAVAALTAGGTASGITAITTGAAASSSRLPVAAVKGADLPTVQRAQRPNIVMVLMDDFSMDLVQTMRSMRQMKRAGASYSHAFVVDSLCCVSRASLFTGQYPHQTGVRTNTSGDRDAMPLGGYRAFEGYGNRERAFNVTLQGSGYTTGFVGKYLNEYEYVKGRDLPPMPPGWSQFNAVFGSAYDGWDFDSTYVRDGRLRTRHHSAPSLAAPMKQRDRAYAGSVIERYAKKFIKAHQDDDAPYFLEVAPYAPHNRTQPQPYYPGDPVFPPAFRDRPAGARKGNCGPVACASLTTRDLPGFGDARGDNRPRKANGKRARAWNTRTNPFRPAQSVADLRNRAMMVQSVDRTVRRILRLVDDNTYVVLTSDNGFHLGQNGLGRGKGTAYDADVHVPLYVVGPGVVPGRRTELTSNVDLGPTFEELAGVVSPAYRSGQSLVPTFADPALVRRNHVFIEHTAQALTRLDPDSALNGDELDRIPSYVAVRSRTGLLIRYDMDTDVRRDAWAYEFYSYRQRRWEKTNAFTQPRYAAEVQALLGKLAQWDQCASSSGDQAVPTGCRTLTQ